MWKQSFDPLFMRFHWGFERSRKNDSARFESHHRHHCFTKEFNISLILPHFFPTFPT